MNVNSLPISIGKNAGVPVLTEKQAMAKTADLLSIGQQASFSSSMKLFSSEQLSTPGRTPNPVVPRDSERSMENRNAGKKSSPFVPAHKRQSSDLFANSAHPGISVFPNRPMGDAQALSTAADLPILSSQQQLEIGVPTTAGSIAASSDADLTTVAKHDYVPCRSRNDNARMQVLVDSRIMSPIGGLHSISGTPPLSVTAELRELADDGHRVAAFPSPATRTDTLSLPLWNEATATSLGENTELLASTEKGVSSASSAASSLSNESQSSITRIGVQSLAIAAKNVQTDVSTTLSFHTSVGEDGQASGLAYSRQASSIGAQPLPDSPSQRISSPAAVDRSLTLGSVQKKAILNVPPTQAVTAGALLSSGGPIHNAVASETERTIAVAPAPSAEHDLYGGAPENKQVLTSLSNPFQHMDSLIAEPRMYVSHSARALEATLTESSQGVLSVRAHFSGGNLNVSLQADSANSLVSLAGQLPSLHAFVDHAGASTNQVSIDVAHLGSNQSSDEKRNAGGPDVVSEPEVESQNRDEAAEVDESSSGLINLRA